MNLKKIKKQKERKETKIQLLQKHIGFRVTKSDFEFINKIIKNEKYSKSEIFRKFMFFLINNNLK